MVLFDSDLFSPCFCTESPSSDSDRSNSNSSNSDGSNIYSSKCDSSNIDGSNIDSFNSDSTGCFFLTGPPLNCLRTNFFTISGT